MISVKFIDLGREPKEKPNPNYPAGIDIDLSDGASWCCNAPLPYPAPRVGYLFVNCDICGANALITTAGRVDDPRSVKLACKGKEQ
jgi:hypothetical protein